MVEMLSLALTLAFLLLAGLSWRLWWQQRSTPLIWLGAMFTAIAVARVISDVMALGFVDAGPGVEAMGRVMRVSVVAFPYLLFRFAAALTNPSRQARLVAGVAAVVAIVATAVVPMPPAGEAVPAWLSAYLLAVMVVWTALTGWVVARLWRAGADQPGVVRRRIRTLAVAAAALNIALLVAAANRGVNADLSAVTQVVALGSAALFYAGVHAPEPLRSAWRRAQERELSTTEAGLMAASSREEVLTRALPYVSHVLGGDAALFVHREGGESVEGDPARLDELRGRLGAGAAGDAPSLEGDSLVLTLAEGQLAVAANAYTPVFGSDEIELLDRFGSVLDLALSRARLFDAEQESRLRAQALSSDLEALLYGIPHDLRTPVVSVLGYIECLEEDHRDTLDEEGRSFLERLRVNAAYIDRLINDLLGLSRAGQIPDHVEPVDLSALAEHVVEDLARQHPQATFRIDPTPLVLIDPDRARQVVTNLLGNALAHSGRPDVTVRVGPAATDADGQACVRVVDDGRGVPAADRDRVFGIFQHADDDTFERSRGSGIGLAMCRRIVQHAGGRIWIADPPPGGGTDIRACLPPALPATHDTTEANA